MESRTKNRKDRDEVAQMVARAFDGAGLADGEEAVVELKDGWFNMAYTVRLSDGREVILKIAPPPGAEVLAYERNIMKTEVDAMRLVSSDPSIPVPEIYFFDQSRDLCDSDYYFMEKIGGDTLGLVRDRLSAEDQAAIDRQIGEIIRGVNAFQGSYFGYEGNPDLRAPTWREAFTKIMEAAFEDGARKGADYGYVYDELRGAVQKHAHALEEITSPCLVHWDAWDLNFFVQDNRVIGIIDFERALWAEPLMEAQFRRPDGQTVTHAMRGYGKTSFTSSEEERSHLYLLYLGVVMNTECYYRNYETDEIFNHSRELIGSAMEWLAAH